MKSISSIRVLVIALVALVSSAAMADPTTGLPPLSSIGSDAFDSVNLSNLNVHFSIPIFSRAGAGMPFTYSLTYDSLVWANGGGIWQAVGAGSGNVTWGWAPQSTANTGHLAFSKRTLGNCQYHDVEYQFGPFTYIDSSGTSHVYKNTLYWDVYDDCNEQTSFSEVAADGSGLKLYAQLFGTGANRYVTATVTAADGTVYTPPQNSGVGGTVVDTNGNRITTSSNYPVTITDTLGTTALTVSGPAPFQNCESSPVYYKYTAPNGGQATVTVSYRTYYIQTNFKVPGIQDWTTPVLVCLVDKVNLPDNSYYQFTYELTNGGGSYVTARIASVRLPTGGVVNYSYAVSGCYNSSNCMMADGSPAYMLITGPSTAWYWRGYQTYNTPQTFLHYYDANSNETDFNFSGSYETSRYAYQGYSTGGKLLKHTTTTYNGCRGLACETAIVTPPISEKTVFDHFSDPSYNYWVAFDYFLNTNGLLTGENDFDYHEVGGNGVIRGTAITYSNDNNICVNKNICARPQSIKITDGNWVQQALTNYHYDSNGNTTEIDQWVSGGSYLTQEFSYNANGTARTVEDPNTWSTLYYIYGYSCNGAFPNSVGIFSQYANQWLYTKYTYNCNDGVITSVTDPNGHVAYTGYGNDKYFWRPDWSSDLAGNVTYYNYYGVNNSGGSVIQWPGQTESVMTWNGGYSIADNLTTVDPYGRLYLQQARQAPGSGNWDTTNYFYDNTGRLQWLSRPITAGAGVHSGGGIASTGYWYDGLGRLTETADWSGLDIKYSYNANDTQIVTGGGQTFSKQLENDALGRLTSVCEMSTTLSGVGACGQTAPQTGYRTAYTYDPLGDLTKVTQGSQTRSYSYDGMSRMLSETNPENGTTRYTYDSTNDGHCNGSSPGDEVERVDAASNYTCYGYDSQHRIGAISYPSGPNTASMPNKYFYYDLPPWGLAVTNGLGQMTAAYTLLNGQNQVLLGFSYDARGSEIREWSLNYLVNGNPRWYTIQASYAPTGALGTIQGFYDWTLTTPFADNLAYTFDGEGRPNGINDITPPRQGSHWCCTTYNPAGQPLAVQSGGNREEFQYDPNSGRMTQWKDTTGTLQTGNLTWNANGTLAKLAISDNANSANNQTCTNTYDDLARVSQNGCQGTPGWSQTFTYDAFGNIEKTGSFTFNPTYDLSTNHVKTFNGYTFQYDGMGNVTSDGTTYTYDAEGRPVLVNGIRISYDALGREAGIGANSPILYSPTGNKIAVFNNGTLQTYLIPLVAGTKLEYDGKGAINLLEADWQGSSRVGKTWNNTVEYDRAYAPFGEFYAEQGSVDRTFTGPTSDAVPGIFDFLFRQLNANQGRWVVPDPAGLAAVDITNPQTWNRYAYVGNNPLSNVDSLGLDDLPGYEPTVGDNFSYWLRPQDAGDFGSADDSGGGDNCSYKECTITVTATDPGGAPYIPGGCTDVYADGGYMGNTCDFTPTKNPGGGSKPDCSKINCFSAQKPSTNTSSAYSQAAMQAIANDFGLFPTVCNVGVGVTAGVGPIKVNVSSDEGPSSSIEGKYGGVEQSGNVSASVPFGGGFGGTISGNLLKHTISSIAVFFGIETRGVELNVNAHGSVTSIANCPN